MNPSLPGHQGKDKMMDIQLNVTVGATQRPEQKEKWWMPPQLAFPFPKPETTERKDGHTPKSWTACSMLLQPALHRSFQPWRGWAQLLSAMPAHVAGSAGIGAWTLF